MNRLYCLTSDHEEAPNADPRWRQEAKRFICSECNSVQKSWYPRPLDVVLDGAPDYCICSGIWYTGIEIFHVKFLEQIRPWLEGFVTGKCLLPGGSVLKDYVTCYTDRIIVRRGAKGTVYNVCDCCGSFWSSGRKEPEYVLRSQLSDSLVYRDKHSSLYLAEELTDRIDFSPWPDTELETVEIFEEPVDGRHLPFDPPSIREKYPEEPEIEHIRRGDEIRSRVKLWKFILTKSDTPAVRQKLEQAEKELEEMYKLDNQGREASC